MKHYTIGQIYKLGLLKNYQGEPYKDKATVSRVVRGLNWSERTTPWGKGKVISEKEIATWNNRFKVV